MIKKGIALCGLVLFALNCSQKADLPLAEDKLVEVIRDIHIAESAMQNLIDLTKDSIGEIYYAQIFRIHKVKKEDFDSSMVILRRDPERMGVIYDRVLEDMERLNDTIFQY